MIVFPNCKINLGLRIVRKRNDGYHDLETLFYPIALRDVLEIIRDPQHQQINTSTVQFSTSGTSVDGKVHDNICIKAFNLLQKDFPQLPAIQMHLHKAIPIGAGLGGGSSDAAFTLSLLNKQFNLGLSPDQLIHYALQLGSDCPFFIINTPCYATGRGEVMEPVTIDLNAYKFIIINPGIHIPTGQAFSNITPALPGKNLKDIIQQPIETWKNDMTNDFEKPIFKLHPEIEQIKNKLYDSGASYASMTGSGSTVYGIVEKDKKVDAEFPSTYFVKELQS
ncbi:4-(cytidine 5'-diphospho)-2-C-methyl-D-erythritol kinase [Terrimonas alba]|uniref:4-(cytidine 5'-diphospho)-2-C-methyl-D-erythritol kinase n=1 Tax=Terrimonas alba TaxID=3349636 RepID=UPI0035F3DE07